MTTDDVDCVGAAVAADCSTSLLIQTLVITAFIVVLYNGSKSAVDRHRLARSRATVVVVGAGPVGLVSALIAVRSGRASRVIVFEERDRPSLVSRSRPISVGLRGLRFLRSAAVGVDLVRTTGGAACLQQQHHPCSLVMRTGALLQCLLDAIDRYQSAGSKQWAGLDHCSVEGNGDGRHRDSETTNSWKQQQQTIIDLRLGIKFTRECLEELENISERIVAVVCDGSCGRAASLLLGLSDEYSHHSCRAYGATATIERGLDDCVTSSPGDNDQLQSSSHSSVTLAAPEIRIHNVTIDMLTATGGVSLLRQQQQLAVCAGRQRLSTSAVYDGLQPGASQDDPFPTGFHLKIFGCDVEHRCMALAVPRCESRVVKALKVVIDHAIMRSIFQSCFNRYKSVCDQLLGDIAAVKCMTFSPRLFEIKLSHRMESVAYIEDANIFIVVEGESARRLNFNAGTDFNLALAGLESLQQFIEQAACAENEQTILNSLQFKFKHGRSISEEFIRHGLKEAMYT